MKKKLYLTFDDGPSRAYTPKLLDLLKRYNIKASFFTVGEFVRENPEIIGRMVEEGHRIQLHGNRHISALLRTRKIWNRIWTGRLQLWEKWVFGQNSTGRLGDIPDDFQRNVLQPEA